MFLCRTIYSKSHNVIALLLVPLFFNVKDLEILGYFERTEDHYIGHRWITIEIGEQ